MNKELIQANKKAFDHWLNSDREAPILVKYANSYEAKLGYEGWHVDENVWESNIDYKIVINDDYAHLRKAAAEGEQLQVSYDEGKHWHDKLTHKITWSDSQWVRIKPKFNIGDWVEVTYSSGKRTIAKVSSDTTVREDGTRFNHITDLSSWTKWKPIIGEFVIPDTGVSVDGFMVMRYDGVSLLADRYEPFFGSLPSVLNKD